MLTWNRKRSNISMNRERSEIYYEKPLKHRASSPLCWFSSCRQTLWLDTCCPLAQMTQSGPSAALVWSAHHLQRRNLNWSNCADVEIHGLTVLLWMNDNCPGELLTFLQRDDNTTRCSALLKQSRELCEELETNNAASTFKYCSLTRIDYTLAVLHNTPTMSHTWLRL